MTMRRSNLKNMMRKTSALYLLFVISPVFFSTVEAQSLPHLIHYSTRSVIFNPSSVRNQLLPSLDIIHRSQWLGYQTSYDNTQGAPTTQQLRFSMPSSKLPIGVGIVFINDAVGPIQQQFGQLSFSYEIKPHRNSTLNLGIGPIFKMSSIDKDEYRLNAADDPAIGSLDNQSSFDLNVGLTYKYGNLHIGLSAFQLSEADLSAPREYAAFASYSIPLHDTRNPSNRALWLKPSYMLRSDYEIEMDAGMTVIYGRLTSSLLWRNEESVSMLVGASLLKNKALGLSYGFELITSNKDAKDSTSHELFLSYMLKSDKISETPVYTPRFPF